jgi:phenylalanyl-tRNA synthetase alpha subunit
MTGFGLSLERPTMIKYKIDNIREAKNGYSFSP